MIRRIWWLALAAIVAAGAAARTEEPGCRPADHACPLISWFGTSSKSKDSCCGNDCCKEGCCKGCCKEGCCKKATARKGVTVVVPVMVMPQSGPAPMHMVAPAPVAMQPPPTPECTTFWPAGMMVPTQLPLHINYPLPPPMPPEPPSYVVELKAVESHEGREDTVSFCPRMCVFDGQQCTVCFDDHEAFLGPCPGCPAKTDTHSCGGTSELGGIVAVQLHGEDGGQVRLELDVQQTGAPQSIKDGTFVQSTGLHAEQVMRLGKVTRLVLERASNGHARRWLEVKVSGGDALEAAPTMPKCAAAGTASCPGEYLPMPKVYCTEECERAAAQQAHAEEDPSGLCDWLQCWAAGMTLPSGHYLQHPPQYMPPAPAFPLTREIAVMEAVPPLPPPVPGPGLPPCPPPVCQEPHFPHPAISLCSQSTPHSPQHGFRVTVDGESCLQVEGGCGAQLSGKDMVLRLPGTTPLHLAALGKQVSLHTGKVHACADSLHAEHGILVLEGHVRLHYSKEACESDVHATRIEINPAGEGSFTVKP
jgi:hypothetical protein